MTIQFWLNRQQDADGFDTTNSAPIDFADVAQQRFKRRFAAQQTVRGPVAISGIGLHCGSTVNLTIAPAPTESGITFVRSDLNDCEIPARFDKVIDTQLCTKIGLDAARSVGTIEHLMAALRALEVDNARITLDAPEVPILDGSARPFLDAINAVGIVAQERSRQVIRVLKTIEVQDNGRTARFDPAQRFALDFDISFDSAAVGAQSYALDFSAERFATEIAHCRTFGFFEEIEMLQKMGLARGGSLDNAIVIKDGEIANPGGLRCEREFVKHKTLDAVGDLYLAGLQIQARYTGDRAGHEMNNLLLKALFADPTAWSLSHQSVGTPVQSASEVA